MIGFLFFPKIKALSSREVSVVFIFRGGLDADTWLYGRTAGEKRVHVLYGEDFTLGADVRPSVQDLFFLFFHIDIF